MNRCRTYFGRYTTPLLTALLLSACLSGSAKKPGLSGPDKALLSAASQGKLRALDTALTQGAQLTAKDDQGANVLILATAGGHRTLVKNLLARKLDPNFATNTFETPLSMAAARNDVKLVKLLIKNGALTILPIEQANGNLIGAAVRTGNLNLIEYLVKQKADLKARDHLDRTSLMHAAAAGHMKIITYLLAQGIPVDAGSKQGQTPLMWAARNGHRNIVKLLIEKGANVNAHDARNSVLVWATAYSGNPYIVRYLLKSGAKPNSRGPKGYPAIVYAAQKGKPNIVETLVASGSEVNIRYNNTTPLLLAIGHGSNRMAGLMIEYGKADVHVNQDEAIRAAAAQGMNRTLQMLLKKGLDVNARGPKGMTPLLHAAQVGHDDTIYLLISKRANLKALDDEGNTALHYAAASREPRVTRILLSKRLDANKTNKDGFTPLMATAANWDVSMAKLLLKQKVDINARNKAGQSVLILAIIKPGNTRSEKRARKSFVKFLIKKGAKADLKDNSGKSALSLAQERNLKSIISLLK